MNEWEVKFSEEEYEQMSNFARVAGFVSVRAAILSLFSLRRVKGFDKDWRYCPNCGMEATIESGQKRSFNKVSSLVREFGAKLVLGEKHLQRLGFKYSVFGPKGRIFKGRGELSAIFRLCGEKQKLNWFLYESDLPWRIEYGDRSLRRVQDFFVVDYAGQSYKNTKELEVVDFIVYGFRTESGLPRYIKDKEI